MAGRKHHHIPQFLQRRFAGKSSGKASQVYVYRHDGKAFKTSTENYGAEKDFYADNGDFFVDDLITDYEADICGLIVALDNGEDWALRENKSIAALIAHLEMRSAYLRQELTFISAQFLDKLELIFSNEEIMGGFLVAVLTQNKSFLKRELLQHGVGEDELERMTAYAQAFGPELVERKITDIASTFRSFFPDLKQLVIPAVKSGHLKALRGQISEPARANRYESLQYRVYKSERLSFLLPDTMISFALQSGAKPFLDKSDRLEKILIPLSSKCILIGELDPSAARTELSINRQLASTSYRSFIFSEEDMQGPSLAKRIGRNANIFGDGSIEKLLREFTDKMARGEFE